MELYIVPDSLKSAFKSNSERVILTEKNFDPCKPFFLLNKHEPESFNQIYIKGVLETTKNLREILKKTDYLLREKGKLKIAFFLTPQLDVSGVKFRAQNKIMNEISVCYKNRYKLLHFTKKENYGEIVLIKTEKTLISGDSMEKWSFGIVSDGRKNEKISEIIKQIERLLIPQFEIIVCGPAAQLRFEKDIKILDDSDLYGDFRIPISRKKNKIIKNAIYENLVIIHDRIKFPGDWYEKIRLYGNYFEFLSTKVLDEKTKLKRVVDWVQYSGDFNEISVNGELLNYSKWTPHVYIDGGYIIGKRSIFNSLLYNDYLHWGEAEDLEMSKRLFLSGYIINLFTECSVTSSNERHEGTWIEERTIEKIKKILYRIIILLSGAKLKNRFKQHNDYKNFLLTEDK